MNADHLRKLAEGRRRAQRERDSGSLSRVRAFRAWLKSGSILRDIPEIPTDADYDVATRTGEGR